MYISVPLFLCIINPMTQKEALNIMKTGVNVYLTGSAGSGKTHTLREYIQWLQEHNIPVAITASTGIAATHMGGMTIHGWAGIGVRESLTDFEIEQLQEKQYLWKRFEKTKVLIIDEVSMLHAHRLDMVERVCRMFKRNDLPFGGIQVILSGDFFQLPPVNKSESRKSKVERDINSESLFVDYETGEEKEVVPESDMVIHSNAWRKMKPAICYLTEQHRQEDADFLNILNAIRDNTVTDVHTKKLKDRLHANVKHVLPTKLYTHNIDVDAINHAELETISGDTKEFVMSGTGSDVLVDILKKSCLAPEILKLKTGAEVMFIKNNYEAGYVNGTRGIVTGFDSAGEPIVEVSDSGKRLVVSASSWEIEENGKVKARITQYPLRLAWAITIHKSQGMSLDSAEIDLSKTFTYGMGYVALSRVRTLEGVRLVGFSDKALMVDPLALSIDKELRAESEENEELFGALPKEKMQELSNDFVVRVGGTLIVERSQKVKSKKSKASPEWLEKIGKIRETFPNASKPWKKEDDALLKEQFNDGATLTELAQLLGRKEGSINLRLIKHGLVEPDEETKSFLERQKEGKKKK